ncbi:MAG: hypothetical protein F6K40_11535 [Okeania sp. SIO3I5]|uniref:hypothetical protein n=1 Tax=Okeania sp. SIO3I5 TaxID=2607805 RepID=UPI0013B8CBD4|nr:hypothetical protein [Okeania sp. SIO3I5]NEQ36875.1 hypothetical protein [Okeania sp. SIO3I5]
MAKVTEIFDSEETLDYLCHISGGHVRDVLRILNDDRGSWFDINPILKDNSLE